VANTKWNVGGDYFESCSCNFLCPCDTNFLARPTQGYCAVIMGFHINQGAYDGLALDGLNFVVAVHTPEEMGKGNWSVGLITDERATPDQQNALTAIVSGQAGGPMAALAPVIGKFLGVEAQPIRFDKDGLNCSVSVPGQVDSAVEGVPGAKAGDAVYYDDIDHPVSTRLALARSKHSHLHAFGLNWDDTSGQNNGHYAAFNWQAG
jgi:hypothetical protein